MNSTQLSRIFHPDTGNWAMIDLFRTIGILQVVFFHVIHGIVRFAPSDGIPDFIDRMPGILNFGWQAYGVDIIFVVSAFLLTWSLLREQAETGRISLRRFYTGRLSRILPIYFIAVALFGLGQGNSLGEILLSALFLGYIFSDFNVVPVGWSMEVMILYYLALPFLILGITALGRPVLWLSLAIIGAALWRYVFLVGQPEDPTRLFLTMIETRESSPGGFALYFRPWFRLPAFLMGTLMAYLLAGNLAPRTLWTPLIALLLILGVVWLPVQDSGSWAYVWFSPTAWAVYWAFSPVVFARAFGFMLIWTLQRGLRRPWVLSRFVTPFSANIFSVYLFHMPFLAIGAIVVFQSTDPAVLGQAGWRHVMMVFVVTSGLTLAFAWPMTRFVERPIQNWLRRLGQS